MNSHTLAGLSLIIGAITMAISAFLAPSSVPDLTQTANVLVALAANPQSMAIHAVIQTVAMVLMLAGYAKVKDSAIDGNGKPYAKLGWLMFALILPGIMIETALIAAAADAAAIAGGAGMPTAAALWAASLGIGSISTVVPLAGMALIGIAIAIQKSYHIVVAILLIITGVLGASFPVVFGYDHSNMLIVWLSLILTTVITGIMTIRSSEES